MKKQNQILQEKIKFKKLYEDWCGFELNGTTLKEIETEISKMIDFLTREVNDNGNRLEKLAKSIFN